MLTCVERICAQLLKTVDADDKLPRKNSRKTLWVAALLRGLWGPPKSRHLGFYAKLQIIKKRRKLNVFDAGHVE